MPRGFYAIISRCGATCKPGSGNGKPCGGMDAPARARAAKAAPEPTCPHRATQPARRGRGEREQTREARGRATGCATAREGFAAGFQRRSAGGQPRRTAGKRRTQQCAGAAALYAATPEPVRRPPMMCPRRRAARIAARSTGTRRPDGTPAEWRAMP